MITDFNGSSAIDTEDYSFTKDPKFIDGYYDNLNEEIDYPKFLADLNTVISGKELNVKKYLDTNLLAIQEDPESSQLTRISYMDTTDSNVRLMQKKLGDLGAFETPVEDQSFPISRSYILSTFRLLYGLGNILTNENKPQSLEAITKQQITSKDEDYFRRPVVRNGVLFAQFMDADVKRNNGYINKQGKVTEKEMGSIVLPNVIKAVKVIKDIDKRTPPFSI